MYASPILTQDLVNKTTIPSRYFSSDEYEYGLYEYSEYHTPDEVAQE